MNFLILFFFFLKKIQFGYNNQYIPVRGIFQANQKRLVLQTNSKQLDNLPEEWWKKKTTTSTNGNTCVKTYLYNYIFMRWCGDELHQLGLLQKCYFLIKRAIITTPFDRDPRDEVCKGTSLKLNFFFSPPSKWLQTSVHADQTL